jgi:hypothetical protein
LPADLRQPQRPWAAIRLAIPMAANPVIPDPLIVSDLLPGDGLIFGGPGDDGLFQEIEKIKLGSQAVHFEVYAGDGKSFTSKPSNGVNLYDTDLTHILRVITPVAPFDVDKAHENFARIRGLPYGYQALLNFENIQIPDRGIFCSETGTLIYRNQPIEPFNWTIHVAKVAPAHYLYVPEIAFQIRWQAA